MLKATALPLVAIIMIGCSGKDGGGSDDTAGTDTQTTDTQESLCTTDICATYGAAVPTVAGQITDAAASDPEFSDAFADLVSKGQDAVDKFKADLADYISDAYGCTTGTYTGPTMLEAHTGMNITQQQYDDFITLIAGVLSSDGVTQDDINYCFAPPLTDPDYEADFIGH